MEKTKNTHRYYQHSIATIKQRVAERRRGVMNSDRYIDARRSIFIDNLNSGKQNL